MSQDKKIGTNTLLNSIENTKSSERSSRTVYEETNVYKDQQTGEIVEKSNKKVTKNSKTPDFIMLFSKGLSILTKSDLTKGQSQALYEILKYTINNSNMLLLNSDIRKKIAIDSGLAKSTVDEYVKALVKKGILIRENRTYMLNPILFGRGDWQNISKLRHTLEVGYDFDTNESYENITTKTLYNNNVNENDEVVSHTKEKTTLGTDETIVLGEGNNTAKESNPIEVLPLDKKSTNNHEINELDMVREKNKELELLNKKKELNIEEMKLKLEMKKEGML